MPSWYVHIQAAAETMEQLNTTVPPGSPLTQTEAMQFHTAGHDHRNYLAAGALGPDLFFLLPDFKGDVGRRPPGADATSSWRAWKAADETFIQQWDTWMTPVLDQHSQLANGISRAECSARSARCWTLIGGALDEPGGASSRRWWTCSGS